MKGYLNHPVATADALRGGRLHTGDIGFIDTEGFVYIVDRKKDMILCGGFNVFPRNAEEAIQEHPAIAEVAAIGIADPVRGQVVKACIVMKEGCEECTLPQLRSYLADKPSAYELPSALQVLQVLPRTPVGKIARAQLT